MEIFFIKNKKNKILNIDGEFQEKCPPDEIQFFKSIKEAKKFIFKGKIYKF